MVPASWIPFTHFCFIHWFDPSDAEPTCRCPWAQYGRSMWSGEKEEDGDYDDGDDKEKEERLGVCDDTPSHMFLLNVSLSFPFFFWDRQIRNMPSKLRRRPWTDFSRRNLLHSIRIALILVHPFFAKDFVILKMRLNHIRDKLCRRQHTKNCQDIEQLRISPSRHKNALVRQLTLFTCRARRKLNAFLIQAKHR